MAGNSPEIQRHVDHANRGDSVSYFVLKDLAYALVLIGSVALTAGTVITVSH